MIDEAEIWFTTQVAEYLKTPATTIRWWRHVGQGPKSFKLGARKVPTCDATSKPGWRSSTPPRRSRPAGRVASHRAAISLCHVQAPGKSQSAEAPGLHHTVDVHSPGCHRAWILVKTNHFDDDAAG